MSDMLPITIAFAAAIFLFVVIGITMNDIRTVRLQHALRQHPYARKWRQRPTVSVVHPETLTDSSKAAVKHSSYRKINMDDTNLSSELLLRIPRSAVIEQTAIMNAVQRFNDRPSKQTVELLPLLDTFPKTTITLFTSHHAMLSAPFAAMRAGYDISPVLSTFPRLDRHQAIGFSATTIVYDISRRLLHGVHLTFLTYIAYLALAASQPALLVMYISSFLLWAIWSIGSYPHLSFMQKIGYFALLPVSGIYFVYRLATAPFRFMPRHARPRNAMIET